MSDKTTHSKAMFACVPERAENADPTVISAAAGERFFPIGEIPDMPIAMPPASPQILIVDDGIPNDALRRMALRLDGVAAGLVVHNLAIDVASKSLGALGGRLGDSIDLGSRFSCPIPFQISRINSDWFDQTILADFWRFCKREDQRRHTKRKNAARARCGYKRRLV